MHAHYVHTHAAQDAHVFQYAEGGIELMCMYTLNMLQNMCHRICLGDISIRELHEVHSKEAQMIRLCHATGGSVMHPTSAVISCLKQRLKEYNYFQVYLKQLRKLLSFLKSVRLQGI